MVPLVTGASKELIDNMKNDLKIKTTFAKILIVWSDIVTHLSWKYPRDYRALEKSRLKMNWLFPFILHP
ncbi:hypothetical protein XELAEV_18028393mg [Xenopus laevis]|uniref:Uncharacterized protein n=1 Tax=Xenopus laevis TaxID=8355 RepID=A0A974CZK7_XENLA|nr:hypothetical protein XELAEV_18028393mg [Xenopus laevis]